MIKATRASVLVVGAMAAVAIGGGAALAASGSDDPVRPAQVSMLSSPSTSSPSPSSPAPSASASSSSAPAAKAKSKEITAAQARKIALKAAGGGRVTDVEREREHGRAVWDTEIQRGNVEHEIDVDRLTGKILDHERDRDDD